MNNHLPYREWIFVEDSLPADSDLELKRHLQDCAECRRAAESWEAARMSLAGAGMKSPRAGFTSRWKALAAERLQIPSRRPAWALLTASSIGSLIMALALALQTSARGFSLVGVFTRDLSAAAGTIEHWRITTNSLAAFLTILSRSIPPACYLLSVFFISLVGILWLIMFVRANSRGEKR